MTVHAMDFREGDRVEWRRAGQKDHATVLAVNTERNQIKLKVDGWVGTCWENVTYSFRRIEK